MDGPGKPVDPNSDVPEPEPHDGNREQLTLFSNFTPLVLSTMTKYSTSDESYTVSISTCTCIACIQQAPLFFRVKEEISWTREGRKGEDAPIPFACSPPAACKKKIIITSTCYAG